MNARPEPACIGTCDRWYCTPVSRKCEPILAELQRPHAGGRFAFAALLLANLFLAFGPWMVRLADVGPVAAAFWRVMLAVPLLLVLAYAAGGRAARWDRRTVAIIAVGGLFFAIDLASWHYGIVRTKLANATLFGNASSFFFPLYGFIVLRHRPRPVQTVALLCALAGTVLLLGRSYELSPQHLTGDLFALFAGLCYVFYLIAVDRVRKRVAAMPVLALSTIAGTVPLWLLALALGEPIVPHHWGPLLLLSLGSQVIGQGLLVYAVGHVRPLVVGLALLTQPVVTAIIGATVYGEALTIADLAGVLLICSAIVLIRLPARLESRAAGAHVAGDRRAG